MRVSPLLLRSLPLLHLLFPPPRRAPKYSPGCALMSSNGSPTAVAGEKRVKAITFDLDDTLWGAMAPLIRANAMHIEHINENYPGMQLDFEGLKAEMKAVRQILGPEASADLTLLRRTTIESLAEKAGYPPAQVSTSAMDVFMRERNTVELFEGVTDTLALLRNKGYILGAITNGNADVEKTPIKGMLNFAIVAGKIGAPKPHPGAFLEACRLAGAAPHQVVHVGDDLETDVGGARGAGLGSVWFRPTRKEGETEEAADVVIEHISELPGVIEAWGGGQGGGA